jgi:hypothetical protein
MSEQLPEFFRDRFSNLKNSAAPRHKPDQQKLASVRPSLLVSVSDPNPRWWSLAVFDGVVQDVAPSNFDVSSIRPLLFFKRRVESVSGKEMRKRAVEMGGNLGLADGKRMLAEQYKIPTKMRDYYIPLPATVLCGINSDLIASQRGQSNDVVIAYLSYEDDSWIMGLHGYDHDWPDNGRLAVC